MGKKKQRLYCWMCGKSLYKSGHRLVNIPAVPQVGVPARVVKTHVGCAADAVAYDGFPPESVRVG